VTADGTPAAAREELLEGLLVEALGLISGATTYLATLAVVSPTPLTEYLVRDEWKLFEKAFGMSPSDGGSHDTDPRLVETHARAQEVVADLLELAGKDVASQRDEARRMREQGTIEPADIDEGGEG